MPQIPFAGALELLPLGARAYAQYSKAFLRRVREVWRLDFPFLKPVDLSEIPLVPKGCRFLCDDYFAERGRAYFIIFDFCPRRIGEFSLSITVSDSITAPFVSMAWTPFLRRTRMYSIGQFMGRREMGCRC